MAFTQSIGSERESVETKSKTGDVSQIQICGDTKWEGKSVANKK